MGGGTYRGTVRRRLRAHPVVARVGAIAILGAVAAVLLAPAVLAPALLAAGPPFPQPVTGQRVYDTAQVLTQGVIESTEARIRDIEAATGAQVVVYTQLVDPSTTSKQADAQAQALMDQWAWAARVSTTAW